MKDFIPCEKGCGEDILKDVKLCSCRPFKLEMDWYFGEKGETRYGLTPESIAESIGEEINQDEHVYDEELFGSDEPLKVTDKDGISKYFNVTADFSINYRAYEVDKNNNKKE